MTAERGRMQATRWVAMLALLSLVGCGAFGDSDGNPPPQEPLGGRDPRDGNGESLFDLFVDRDDPNITVAVNKYLWDASLEVLNFLPIQSADPFSGVIVTGFGTPPGGSRAYRATILIRDPALDARSLNIALATRGGTASADTVRAVEDAILTRARQLRQRDLDL